MSAPLATGAPKRTRRLAGPLAVAAGAVLAGGATLLVPPGDGGFVACPFRALTGLDCPFCGATRATAALLRGDLLAAIDHNAFYVLAAAPLFLLAWLSWVRAAVGGRPFPALPNWAWQALLWVTLAWWAVRLAVPWLGSGLSG
jgi:hypothetical protein